MHAPAQQQTLPLPPTHTHAMHILFAYDNPINLVLKVIILIMINNEYLLTVLGEAAHCLPYMDTFILDSSISW